MSDNKHRASRDIRGAGGWALRARGLPKPKPLLSAGLLSLGPERGRLFRKGYEVSPQIAAGLLWPRWGARATPRNKGSTGSEPSARPGCLPKAWSALWAELSPPFRGKSTHSDSPGFRFCSTLRKPSEETHPVSPGTSPERLQRGQVEATRGKPAAHGPAAPGASLAPFSPSGEGNYLKKRRGNKSLFTTECDRFPAKESQEDGS